MAWPQNDPQPTMFDPNAPDYKPQLENAAWLAERDRLLAAWEAAKGVLERAKESEMEARKAAQRFAFGGDAREGMNNQELANGYVLKFGKKLNYKIAATNAQVDYAEDKAHALGERGTLLFERVITWTPNFSKSEYNKLDEADATDRKVKQIVDEIIEITEATGSLEIKEPKAKLNG